MPFVRAQLTRQLRPSWRLVSVLIHPPGRQQGCQTREPSRRTLGAGKEPSDRRGGRVPSSCDSSKLDWHHLDPPGCRCDLQLDVVGDLTGLAGGSEIMSRTRARPKYSFVD